MNTEVYVGTMGCYTLEELAHDNEWRFREAVQPVVGEHVPMLHETYYLFGVLGRLSAAGFLTYQSQPARLNGLDEDVREFVDQRAFVHGYTSDDKAKWIASACEGKLECYVTPVRELAKVESIGRTSTKRVTGDDGEVLSATFHAPSRELHEDNVHCTRPEAQADMENAMCVTVIDPVYGRDWFLWDTLVHALR